MTDNTKPKSIIVYRALLNGIPVKLPDGNTYAVDDVGNLLYQLKVYKGGFSTDREPDELRYALCDMSFNSFVSLCEQLSDIDAVDIAFSACMSTMNNSPFQPLKWENDND